MRELINAELIHVEFINAMKSQKFHVLQKKWICMIHNWEFYHGSFQAKKLSMAHKPILGIAVLQIIRPSSHHLIPH